MKKIETTLALLKKDNKILLALKKRGFGEGKYNGVGGNIENGETVEQARIRETWEEINVTPREYEKVAIIEFDEFYKGNKENVVFHLYLINEWDGEPSETEEMKPSWFEIDKMPYDKMFPDDKYWMPYILDGKKINAYFEFDKEWNVVTKRIEEVEKF